MKYNSKKFFWFIVLVCFIALMGGKSFAHSGRTDSNGGHKDNQNKSGLGSYHYHCGGNPAHLHENGVCQYSSSKSTSSTSSSSKKTSSTTSSSVDIISKAQQIVTATSIEINEKVANMKVGETNKLTATIIPENTENKNIIWESSDENIATVSSTGKVVALKPGAVRITVNTVNGKTDTVEINIEEEKKNTIAVSSQISEFNNENTNNTEESDSISGLLGLGCIGLGGYWGYKKYKKS